MGAGGLKWLAQEQTVTELRLPDLRAWDHYQPLISPRLPSNLLCEILRQTGAVGFVAGMLHGSAAESGGLGAWSTWVLPRTLQSLPTLWRGNVFLFCEVQPEVVILHFSFVYTSFISSLYPWIDSSKDLEFHHENASTKQGHSEPL